MKSKLIKAVIAVAVAVAVGFGGYFGYKTLFPTKAAAVTPQYYTAAVRKMNLQQTVQGTGAAYPASTKDVMPNNNGTISGLSVKVGDTVTAGQKLFSVSGDNLTQAVTSAKNNLTKANLSLSSDQNNQTQDINKVAADKQAVSDAQAQLDAAKAKRDNEAISAAQKSLDDANKTLTNDQNALTSDANKITLDKLSVSDAQTQLTQAQSQYNNMTVAAPIAGVITAVNNSDGDSVQSGKAVLTIVDMTSLKVKVSVDELDINKIQVGQAAVLKFDAVSDKSFEGSVESIAQTGTTSNNVTNYDVVVDIKEPSGIKPGMNANVTITTQSKENALVIPAEALVEMNGQKYVRVEDTSSTGSTSNNQSSGSSSQGQSGNRQSGSSQGSGAQNWQGGNGQSSRQSGTGGFNRMQAVSGSNSRLVAIKTGLDTQNYIEVTDGVTEGQKVLIQLPSTSSTTTNSNRNTRNSFSGNMGGFGGGNMGGFGGGTSQNRSRGD